MTGALETTLTPDRAQLALNRQEAGNRVTTEHLAGIASFLDEVAAAAPAVLVIEGRGERLLPGA